MGISYQVAVERASLCCHMFSHSEECLMKALKGLLILAVMTAACSTLTVSSDWDHTVNFANFQTYDMREGTRANNPLIRDRIDRSVNQTLQSRGLRRDAQNPQILVYTPV